MEATVLQKRWILYGAITGILSSMVYPIIYYIKISPRIDLLIGLIFGFCIAITTVGIYQFIRIHHNCMCLQIGGITGILAGFTYILNVTVFQSLHTPLEGILVQGDQSFIYSLTSRIHMGLSLSWEILIACSIFALGVAFFRQPKPGKIIFILGIIEGLIILLFNFYAFPEIPESETFAGLGPFLPIWHLVVSILILSSLKWIKEKSNGI